MPAAPGDRMDHDDARDPSYAGAPSIVTAEIVGVPFPERIPPFPNPFRHPLQALVWLCRLGYRLTAIVMFLAVCSAVPLLNFFALGCLLEAEGRMGRSGRLRDAFPLWDVARRALDIGIGVGVFLLGLKLLASAAADAQLIAPGSPTAAFWLRVPRVAAPLVAVHILLALARGGTLSCFFRPLKNITWFAGHVWRGTYWATASAAVDSYFRALNVWPRFWLGVKGFVAGLAWLFIPTALLSVVRDIERPEQSIPTLLGGVLLMCVLGWMPFLQAHLAAENRLRAGFALGHVRELQRRAPFAHLIAVLVTLLLALPLYLLKIKLPPQDALWMLAIVFIASIYPARIVVGWAYHRALARSRRAWFGWRWLCRGALIPLLGLFVLLLFFTQWIDEHGRATLFEHHAFLLPIPL
ncbi:MAG: hypothetical protein D6725_11710 [Planctomycetota bacterium]|nr:MAG: hypothetical protein D6725_11710 [Planctomycetota bacterium]